MLELELELDEIVPRCCFAFAIASCSCRVDAVGFFYSECQSSSVRLYTFANKKDRNADATRCPHPFILVHSDVLLARGLQASSCDWHVDDQSFWPESYLSSASAASGKDQSGINVWIALDDMPMKYGGSMVVSSGSHQAPWRLEAYQVIGQNRTKDGGATKEQFAEGVHDRLRKGLPPFLTCAMSGLEQNENVSSMLEENRREFDLARGDIILSSRLTFHKTVDVTEAGLDFYNKQGIQSLDRYSIRYTPGSARLPLGWTTEWSMVSNPENAGRTLDEVAQFDGSLWYPQVWPEIKEGTDMLLDELATTILESSKQKAATESSSLRSLLTLSKS
jgi:hypothetical protein